MENPRKSLYCSIVYGYKENDNGHEHPSLTVTCPECGKEGEAWGYSEASVRRACWVLSSECEDAQGEYFYKVKAGDGVPKHPRRVDPEPRDEIPF